MKKHLYMAEAERLYVVEQMSMEQIAKRFGVSLRTIQLWAQQGDWRNKRIKHLSSVANVHQELYLLLKRVVHSALSDINEGKKVDATRLNFIRSLAPTLLKLKQYEQQVEQEKQQNKEQLTEEMLTAIESLLNLK